MQNHSIPQTTTESTPPVTICPDCGAETYEFISDDGPSRAVDTTPWPRQTNSTYALALRHGAMNGAPYWKLLRTIYGQPPPPETPVYRLHRLSCGKGA